MNTFGRTNPSSQDQGIESAGQFRAGRLAQLEQYYLMPSPFVLHLVPLHPPANPVNLAGNHELLSQRIPPPIWGRGRPNSDGFFIQEQERGMNQAHVQYFSHGAVEVYVGGTAQDYPRLGRRVIWGEDVENQAVVQVEHLVQVLGQLGVRPPLAVLLSLLDVQGAALISTRADRFRSDLSGGIAQRDLLLPPAIIPTHDADVPAALHPVFDLLWQATGWPQSPTYSAEGAWGGSRRL